MTQPSNEQLPLPERVSKLEQELPEVRRDATDALNLARVLDRDVANLDEDRRSNPPILNALRETQLKQGKQLNALSNTQSEHTAQLNRVTHNQIEHSEQLDTLRTTQLDHGFTMAELAVTQSAHSREFTRITRKLEKLGAGVEHVAELLTTDKNRREQT